MPPERHGTSVASVSDGEKYFVPMRVAMTLLSNWVSLQKKAAMNALPVKSSLFRKRPDGLNFQHSAKFSILFY